MKTSMGMTLLAGLLAAGCDADQRVAARASAVAAERDEVEPGAISAEPARATVFLAADLGDDADHDGAAVADDPDDSNPDVYPGAPEVLCNGEDEDGDLGDSCPPDADGDGARADVDCDDADVLRGPRAGEIRCNGRDENCEGLDDCDRDADGVDDRDDLDPDDPTLTLPEAERDPSLEH